ncbi:MAG TPA: protein-disulfide reductase DsbD domain-containing protein [Rhizomicrobium sp.]|nr:protein-disulfide reductase DsbD domain-containing protein [Rhizomicrobium sp.]
MTRFVLAFLLALVAPASAQVDNAPKVRARLVAERDAVAPGGTASVALELATRPGWHTYWINPGDAGAATEIRWRLPAGWKAGAIQWPAPQAEAVGPLMDYGYEGKPWLLVDITAPTDASGTATLSAHASWLVCAEVCVPEEADLTLPMNVGDAVLPADPAFAAARAKLPVTSPWPMRYALGQSLELFVESAPLASAHPAKAEFFPLTPNAIKGIAPQRLGFAENGLVLRLAPGKAAPKGTALDGVLVLTSSDGSTQALQVAAMPGAVPNADFGGDGNGSAGEVSFRLALLFAFLGGLILNLMPCVLPILAMKALSLAQGHAAREGLAYGLGAILSFAALGAALVALRAGGAAIGWGFQLQEPVAVGLFALLIFAVGLNLSGVFELPGFGGGDALTRRGGAVGAFFTGVLAVAVAAPCTAPFMAAALGYALTQPTATALAVFVALGMGFAAPFVLIGVSPRLLSLIPKPGAWMLTLKQFLAFPMYGASVWLVWVLANESGPNAVVAVLASMVAFALAVWIWTATRSARTRGRGFGALASLIAFIASLAFLATLLYGTPAPALARVETGAIPHEPYSAARLARLRAEHRAVFVNATAAWCITCLVNERVAFSSGAVAQAFAKHKVACLIADWTRRDGEITKLLEAHHRDGVPLYLYYAPDAADAKVLPQILTESEVLKAVGG